MKQISILNVTCKIIALEVSVTNEKNSEWPLKIDKALILKNIKWIEAVTV